MWWRMRIGLLAVTVSSGIIMGTALWSMGASEAADRWAGPASYGATLAPEVPDSSADSRCPTDFMVVARRVYFRHGAHHKRARRSSHSHRCRPEVLTLDATVAPGTLAHDGGATGAPDGSH